MLDQGNGYGNTVSPTRPAVKLERVAAKADGTTLTSKTEQRPRSRKSRTRS